MSDFTTPSLALMLLLTGFAYSLPVLLFPSNHSLNGSMSSEVLNLYFLVGWMGLAHFIYAYYGQALALKRNPANLAPYLIGVVLGAIVLATMRYFMGFMLFSFLMWIYFLPHFVKAEIHFTTVLEKKKVKESAGVYLFPAIAFSFFTFALFGPVEFVSNPWNLILMAVGCLVLGLFLGLKKQLSDRGRFSLRFVGNIPDCRSTGMGNLSQIYGLPISRRHLCLPYSNGKLLPLHAFLRLRAPDGHFARRARHLEIFGKYRMRQSCRCFARLHRFAHKRARAL